MILVQFCGNGRLHYQERGEEVISEDIKFGDRSLDSAEVSGNNFTDLTLRTYSLNPS